MNNEVLNQAQENLETRIEERTAELSHANTLLQQEICDRHRVETALQQQIELQRLVMTIAQRIRQSLNLNKVLNTTVAEVRQFLKADRVFIYRFEPDYSGSVVVESVGEEWISVLNAQVEDNYFIETRGEEYKQGHFQAVADISTADLTECHRDLLTQFQVQSKLSSPHLRRRKVVGIVSYQPVCNT